MKKIFVFFILLTIFSISKGQNSKGIAFINPAGYYSLDSKTKTENGETYGYFGTIKIKLVDSTRILADFYICKGAPDYNSGTFEDTLLYKNNIAIHTTSDDNTCVIIFNFNTTGGVSVDEKTKNHTSGCGFGNGIVASGFYNKIDISVSKVQSK